MNMCAACKHTFGFHYTTYDTTSMGCSFVHTGRTTYAPTDWDDFQKPCTCKGYAEVVRLGIDGRPIPDPSDSCRQGGIERVYGDNRDFGQESPFPPARSC